MSDQDSIYGDAMPTFYVGHHETQRAMPVSEELVQHAYDLGYDMLSAPITNGHFHSRVLNLLSAYDQALSGSSLPADARPLPLIPAIEAADTDLGPTDRISQLVTFASSWIDLSSPDPVIAALSRQVFHLEIAYAAFCGVMTVVVPGPRLCHGPDGIAQYARAIKEALATGAYITLHILLPMDGSKEVSQGDEDLGDLRRFAREEYMPKNVQSKRNPFAAWSAWNTLRTICAYHSRLCVALDLPRRLPSFALQSRWFSESVRLLSIPGSSFLLNPRGSAVLSKPHQAFIFRLMRLQRAPWILLSDIGALPGLDDPDMVLEYPTGEISADAAADASISAPAFSPEPTPAEAAKSSKSRKNSAKSATSDPSPHLSYLRYLQRNQPPKTVLERFGGGFQDYLQSPLQPLADNLESITYEVFEKDPVKYEWYERATAAALRDWQKKNWSTSSEDGAVVIAVVGSGRGPLVTRALNAAKSTGVKVKVYAVEKNPNAYVLLQRRNESHWEGAVTVVKTDMRAWNGPLRPDGTPGKVDILISELLGSFADNELSPECLDGVQHVLNPRDGISIPASYTAHCTPIQTPKLWYEIKNRTQGGDAKAFDIPWVVLFHQMDYLSAASEDQRMVRQLSSGTKPAALNLEHPLIPDVQVAWEFVHPLPASHLAQAGLRRGGSAVGGGGGFTGGDGANEHNVRFCQLKFDVQNQGICHGIGGYFETVLYKGDDDEGEGEDSVELSTNPVTMEDKSKDMISWFPIFFPVKTPIHTPANSQLQISMWRQTDDRKVWYEWLVESFMQIGDERVRLATSDLMSSRESGCLM